MQVTLTRQALVDFDTDVPCTRNIDRTHSWRWSRPRGSKTSRLSATFATTFTASQHGTLPRACNAATKLKYPYVLHRQQEDEFRRWQTLRG
jgi:hypothetical protein